MESFVNFEHLIYAEGLCGDFCVDDYIDLLAGARVLD
jgi:hypothetical protein